MPPKKNDPSHYYGFDSSGLEKAAAVSKALIPIPFTLLRSCVV